MAGKKPKKASTRKPAKKTKDETVDVSTGLSLLLGDNGPPNKDLIYHLEQISGYMDKARTANSRVSDAKKKAKEAGVNVKAIMQTMADLKLDPLELADRLKQQSRLYAEKGMPIQFKLYEPAYGDIDEQAAAEGRADGTHARTMNIARWPENSPGHVAYTRAWNDSQRENAEKIGKSDAAEG